MGRQRFGPAFQDKQKIGTGLLMDDSVQKSCWGVTAWAVVGVACVIVLALLFGDFESAAVLAAN